MAKRSYPLAKVYGLLEPGPVILLSTAHKGRANVMTLSWLTMMEFEPPLVGCVLGEADFSHGLLLRSRECVINIPTEQLADAVVGCGNTSGADTDKFAAFGLTPLPSKQVAAPRIAECFANLECRVVDTRMVKRYGLFVLEVVHAWVDPARARGRTLHHTGQGWFVLDGERVKLPSRMK
ncbi:MAG: flavin reductase family protein [Pseudomonadota bacterium]